jgi:NAD-dependent SIR2 family protein deacetylase
MNTKKQGGMGSGGYCVCVQCGVRVPHRRGVPCLDERCPKCGRALLREGSEHHRRATSPKKA